MHAESMSATVRRRREEGFTLIELMVVIIIIGLLATFAAPRVFRMFTTAKDGIAKSELARVKDAVDMYRITFGKMPESLEDLRTPPDGSEPLLEKDPIDPWGNPYELKRTDGSDYDIISYGADGEPGGEGENADLSYKDSVKRGSGKNE